MDLPGFIRSCLFADTGEGGSKTQVEIRSNGSERARPWAQQAPHVGAPGRNASSRSEDVAVPGDGHSPGAAPGCAHCTFIHVLSLDGADLIGFHVSHIVMFFCVFD